MRRYRSIIARFSPAWLPVLEILTGAIALLKPGDLAPLEAFKISSLVSMRIIALWLFLIGFVIAVCDAGFGYKYPVVIRALLIGGALLAVVAGWQLPGIIAAA